LPFGFARLQTTDISGWHGSTKDPRWQTVVDSIDATLGDETRRLSSESHAAADELPPVPTLDVVPHNLPMDLTSFVGRDAEVHELVQLLN
jgi:hypothetical protein